MLTPTVYPSTSSRFGAVYLIDPAPTLFTRFEALPEGGKPGYYPGVLIIEKGPAKGHFAVKDGTRVVNFDASNPAHADLPRFPIIIGDDTLNDVVQCGNASDNTKCKLDHGSTVRDVVGSYATFRRDGDRVRADLTLMESTGHRAFVEELIAKMSKKIGNSIDFDYRYEIQGDVAIARCVRLNSVDIVDTPAATNSLFNENPENQNTMALSKEDLAEIGKLVTGAVDARFTALETNISTRLGKIETTVTKLEEGDGETDEEKKKREEDEEKKKAELSSGITEKALMGAFKKMFPSVPLESFATQGGNQGSGDYDTKFAACKESGMTDGEAIAFIARKHPALYNAKFGGTAANNTKL